ncbi:MAG: hypothetical protein FJ392_11005, partial [Verrucomicrobia bacterium]|nr:hypothetical protein [Verrucomicrobiota bacterium]
MPTLQEFIHSLEEGTGARAMKWVGFVVTFITLAVAYDLRGWRNFSSPEAMDAAQLARNLAEGRGFTTQHIRPASLYLLGNKSGSGSLTNAHPDLANAPAWPILLSGAMRVLPLRYEMSVDDTTHRFQPELAIAWVNQGLFLVALLLTWRLGRVLFDSLVAWLSTAGLLGADLLWRFSISGLPTMLALVLMLLLAVLLVA